jgi:hypothetical protein
MTQARNLSRLLNKDITTYMYTATAGQTAFTGSDNNSQTLTFDNQSIMVTYNGVMLEKGSEFTVATNTVTLLAGAEVNAEVNVIVFNNASLGGYVKSTGGDIDGGVNITSGHLLVGTTAQEPSVSNDDSGFSVRPVGTASISRTSGPSLDLNRKTTDGEIAVFRKDGTEVGSVATYGGDLIVGTGDTRLRFVDSLDSLLPVSNSTGTSRDAGIDLGHSETRFKDIYTSGGIYLGAASNSTPVAANKLDDYEEGEFDVAFETASGSITLNGSFNRLAYVKIGKLVTISGRVNISGVSNPSGYLRITLPFTVQAGTDHSGYSAMHASSHAVNLGSGIGTFWEVATNSAYAYYNILYANASWVSDASIFTGSGSQWVYISGTYLTNQ